MIYDLREHIDFGANKAISMEFMPWSNPNRARPVLIGNYPTRRLGRVNRKF